MPTARISNNSPTGKIRNTDTIGARMRELSKSTTTGRMSVSAGTPIGLLLAFTYATDQTIGGVTTLTSLDSVFARIRNTD